MSVRSAPKIRGSDVLAGACGAAYGLGLARFLFEWQPERLGWLGGWAGTLAVAGGAAVVAWLASRVQPPTNHGGRRAPTKDASSGWGSGFSGWMARIRGAPGNEPAAVVAVALPLVHVLAQDVNPLRGAALLVGGLSLWGLARVQPPTNHGARRAPTIALSLFLFLSLFVLYLRTLAPAVGEADTFEFQVGIARLGIAHGSGYPLLMLVGKLFTLLPLGGSLAWRANLTSAFFGALAAVMVQQMSGRLGAGRLPALLAGLAFGVSPTLWSRAVEVEAYTLNAALVGAILYVGVDLSTPRPPSPLQGEKGEQFEWWKVNLLALCFGLSLGNHLTTVLLAPACAVAVARGWARKDEAETVRRRESSPSPLTPLPPGEGNQRWVLVLVCLALGLSVYAYLPLRWPAVNGGERLSWQQFTNIVTGGEAKGAFQWSLPFRELGRYGIVFNKVAAEYGWTGLAALGFGVGLLGLAAWRALRRRSGQLPVTHYPLLPFPLLILFLAYGAYLYFGLAFNVPDPDFSAFLIPLHLITAVLMGLGAQAALNWLEQAAIGARLGAAASGVLGGVLLASFGLLALRSVWRTLPQVDRSGDWERYRQGQFMLSRPLARGATILADSQKIAPLYYLQVAEGVRRDLDIVVLPDEASYRAALDERSAAGQTVYLGRFLPGVGADYSLRSVGPLAEVSAVPFSTAPLELAPALGQPRSEGLRLLGYRLEGTAAAPGPLRLTLAWQPEATPGQDLRVSLRLVDEDGRAAWESAGRVPVSGLYPTNAWRPKEVVTDYYEVPVEPSLRPGRYRLEAGLFAPFAQADEAGWWPVTDLEILPPSEQARPPHRLRDQIGAQWLAGYAAPESAAPGSRVDVTLYWLRSTAGPDVTAFGETRSLAAWPPGLVAPQVYSLTAPQSGALELRVGSGEPARCGWLSPPTEACSLPAVRVAEAAVGASAANFDNLLRLNRAILETSRAAPGGEVRLTLEWQGLQRMSVDYTVFVHLLGPDGRVHGQVDAWPVAGTRATSSWTPGEIIHDTYSVPVADDAPEGEYQVEIGLYLLASGERLGVLDEGGRAVDDRVLLGGLTIGQ